MRNILIEMAIAGMIALCIYYVIALPLIGNTHIAAGLAAGLGGFIAIRIGKKRV